MKNYLLSSTICFPLKINRFFSSFQIFSTNIMKNEIGYTLILIINFISLRIKTVADFIFSVIRISHFCKIALMINC